MARKNKTRRKQNVRPDAAKARPALGQPTHNYGTAEKRVLIGIPAEVERRVKQLARPAVEYKPVPSPLHGDSPVRSSSPRTNIAKAPTEKHRTHSKLSLALSPPEPDRSQSSPKAREDNRCKKRPDSKKAARSKGGGGGKKFIPWCG